MGSAILRYRVHAVVFAVGLVLGVAAYARIGPGSATLDPGVQAALLLVISVTLAATAGAAGAVIGASIAAEAVSESSRLAQEAAQASRTDALAARAEDRQDARTARFADRKLTLAVDLLLAADLHSDQSRVQVAAKADRWQVEIEYGLDEYTGTIPSVDTTQPVRDGLQALDLVAPAVAQDADRLYQATLPLGDMAAHWVEPGTPGHEPWAEAWATTIIEWGDARRAYVEAVRADLGVNPDDRHAAPPGRGPAPGVESGVAGPS